MNDQPGLTPPSEPHGPAWGEAPAEPPGAPAPPASPYAPPAPPPYGVPVAYQQVSGQQMHSGGLSAMVLGIIGVVSGVLALPTSGITAVGMLCSPVALGLGLWSSRVIRGRPDLYNNHGHAVAGWVLGLVGVVLGVLMLLLAVAFVALIIWVYAGLEP